MHFIVLIWGFTGALGKLIHVEALPLVWHRIALAALCMILFAGLTRRRIVIPPRDLLAPLVLNSAIIVVHWITFYHAIKLSNVSLTLACLSTGPFFTSLLEPLFFKRRILPAEILLGGGVVAGMMLLFGSVEGHQTAILVGLTSSILSALFSVMNGRIVQRMTPLDISFWEMSMGVIMLSLYLASQGELTPSILSPNGHGLGLFDHLGDLLYRLRFCAVRSNHALPVPFHGDADHRDGACLWHPHCPLPFWTI